MSDYHGRTMNLQSGTGSYVGRENTISFKEGHRDARHAAAEIAIEAEHEITTLRKQLAESQARADNCEREARQWRQEARTQSSIVAEIYEAVTGNKGEPGDWNGANPVNAKLEALRGRVAMKHQALAQAADSYDGEFGRGIPDEWQTAIEAGSPQAWLLREKAEAVLELNQYFWGKDFVDIRLIIAEHADKMIQAASAAEKGEV